MPKRVILNVFDIQSRSFKGGELIFDGDDLCLTIREEKEDTNLYLAPGFIDIHTHIFDGLNFCISPAKCGLAHGVHLLVDAGSAGAHNIASFRDYIAPQFKTKIKAFLNISSLGLVSGQPYYDMRYVDPELTAKCIKDDEKKFFVGIKILCCRIRAEDSGIVPLKLAVQAAELAGCPLMVHVGSGPPYNDEIMPLLRQGDIVTHCFHGDKYRTDKSNILWQDNGMPTPPLKEVLNKGVILDVGHGSASLSSKVARSVVESGMHDFIISTDIHLHSINGPVWGLAETMSKFLSFGMELGDVIHSVTTKPANALGIKGWGLNLSRDATIFRLRKACDGEKVMKDSLGNTIPIEQWVEPVAVIMDSKIFNILPSVN